MRVTAKDIGQPRRGSDDERHEANQFRILSKQGEKPPSGTQACQKPIECGKTRIWIFGARELIENDRNEIEKISASLLAAQRAIRSVLPIVYCLQHECRVVKPKLREPLEDFGVGLGFVE